METVVGFFEAFVRPNLTPDFRPNPSQQAPALPEDERLVELSSGHGKVLRYAFSNSYSYSKSKATETQRRYDIGRIFNPTDPGQFIEAEIVKRLRLREVNGNTAIRTYATPQNAAGVQIISRNHIRNS